MKTYNQYITESALLLEASSPHHRAIVKHGYRPGTATGTAGYFTKTGFVHVYTHEAGHEVHVASDHNGPKNWVHVSAKGQVHRVGKDPKELHTHLAGFHPEVAEKAKQQREKKATAADKKKRDDLLARKQGQVMDKIIASGKLPAIALNGTPKQPSVSQGSKKKK